MKRDVQINFRVTVEEKKRLTKNAEREYTNIGNFIRKLNDKYEREWKMLD